MHEPELVRENKIRRRVALVQKVANEAATFMNEWFQKNHSVPNAVSTVHERTYEVYVRRYFDNLELFRKRHRYPDGRLVNNAKIAGLMLKTMLDGSAHDFFVVTDMAERKGARVLLTGFFAFELVCAILGVKKLSVHHFREDFLMLVNHYDADAEWICFAMDAIWHGYGDQKVKLTD